MTAINEVFLKADPSLFEPDPGRNHIVGGGQNFRLHSEPLSQLTGHHRQGCSLVQSIGAVKVGRKVPVADPKACVEPQAGHVLHDREFIPGDAPTMGTGDTRQGVEHGVEVGRNMQAIDFFVIPGIHHNGQSRTKRGQALGQAGSSNTAG